MSKWKKKTPLQEMVGLVELANQMGTTYPSSDNNQILYINQWIKDNIKEAQQVSDGYHTFEELYNHRIRLWIELCKSKLWVDDEISQNHNRWSKTEIWMTDTHSDGSSWEGWFVLGMNRENGYQITYHLPKSYWEECTEFAKVVDKAPEFDGHTSADVLERLKEISN